MGRRILMTNSSRDLQPFPSHCPPGGSVEGPTWSVPSAVADGFMLSAAAPNRYPRTVLTRHLMVD
jgi:hypothetical protein